MYQNQNEKLKIITEGLLIVGIDIAKNTHWAQIMLHNGITIGKPFKIQNTREGFESLLHILKQTLADYNCKKILIGLEPTGHYWKALAWYLEQNNIQVVTVNPYHVKKSKELDDNTQTKSDPKDAGTIGRLVKEGRFSMTYIPQGIYGELRELNSARNQLKRSINALKNIIHAIIDEHFPEYPRVFKEITGKVSLHLLSNGLFPDDVRRLHVEGILQEIRLSAKRGVGLKRAQALYQAAEHSIGLPANSADRIRLQECVEQFTLLTRQMTELETQMEIQLKSTGLSEYILSIKGVGIVTAAGFLGEIGDPKRFTSWKQIQKLAGYNLVEQSSGTHRGKKRISKRGRPNLRNILYQIALVLISKSPEFKAVYKKFIIREQNQLKKKQAIVAVMNKFLRVVMTVIFKREFYDSTKIAA